MLTAGEGGPGGTEADHDDKLAGDNLVSEPTLTGLIIESYEGEKLRGHLEGHGKAMFLTGNTYEGEFSEGTMHGCGTYTHVERGIVYTGDIHYNEIRGRGVYTWPDGSRYEGGVLNGIRHGVGVYWHAASGVTYSGEWVMGVREGLGRMDYETTGAVVMTAATGGGPPTSTVTSYYDGEWVNGQREGLGFRQYASGNTYEGTWLAGCRHGHGTMRWLDRNEMYSGQWEHGVQHGLGQHVWFVRRVAGGASQYPLRNVYDGEFCQGVRHGQGVFIYPNGTRYSGGWQHNMKHGRGKLIFKNGRVYEGEFVHDRIVEHAEFALGSGRSTPDVTGLRTRSPLPNVPDEHQLQLQHAMTTSSNSSAASFAAGMAGGAAGGGGGVAAAAAAMLVTSPMYLQIDHLLQELSATAAAATSAGARHPVPFDFEDELKQVHCVLLQNLDRLRQVYQFYAALGHQVSEDNTYIMTQMQFWQFCRDCRLHQGKIVRGGGSGGGRATGGVGGGLSLPEIDRVLARATRQDDPLEMHNPTRKILFLPFVNHIVTLAFVLYKSRVLKDLEQSDTAHEKPNNIDENNNNNPNNSNNNNMSSSTVSSASTSTTVISQCLKHMLAKKIEPNVCRNGGTLFKDPSVTFHVMNYFDRAYQIYQQFSKPSHMEPFDPVMTMRDFMFMMQDLNLVNSDLTASRIVDMLASEDTFVRKDQYVCLNRQITFSEFIETLSNCASYFVTDEKLLAASAGEGTDATAMAPADAAGNSTQQQTSGEAGIDLSSSPAGGAAASGGAAAESNAQDATAKVAEVADESNNANKSEKPDEEAPATSGAAAAVVAGVATTSATGNSKGGAAITRRSSKIAIAGGGAAAGEATPAGTTSKKEYRRSSSITAAAVATSGGGANTAKAAATQAASSSSKATSGEMHKKATAGVTSDPNEKLLQPPEQPDAIIVGAKAADQENAQQQWQQRETAGILELEEPLCQTNFELWAHKLHAFFLSFLFPNANQHLNTIKCIQSRLTTQLYIDEFNRDRDGHSPTTEQIKNNVGILTQN